MDFWSTSWDPDSLDPVIESLIKKGDVETIQDFLVNTPQSEVALSLALPEAIFHRNVEVVECIINAKAPISSTYEFFHDTPLHFKPTYRILQPTPFDDLFGNPNDNPTHELSRLTPLHCAARYGDIKIVQCLLKSGAPIEAKSAFGETPLHSAFSGWSSSIDAMRANQQATNIMNWRDKPLKGTTPAHYTEIIKLLVKEGASMDFASPHDFIIYYAVHVINLDIVRCLVKHAVDKFSVLNATHSEPKTGDSLTALWRAVRWQDLKMVRYLLEEGADAFCQCISAGVGQLAIHAVFDLYSDRSGLEIIKCLIRFDGGQMMRTTSDGNAYLHLAAKNNNAKCAA